MFLSLSSRLARREVRRRPGRTVLVMLLVMIPFTAIGIGSMFVRTSDLSTSERLALSSGRADLEISITDMRGSKACDPGSWIRDILGPDASWTRVGYQMVPMTVAGRGVPVGDESRNVVVETMDLSSPVNAGAVEILEGGVPRASDSVVLSKNLADLWKKKVGDRLNLERPQGSYSVVGIARAAIDLGGNRVWTNLENSLGTSVASTSEFVRVDIPGAKAGQLPDRILEQIARAANSEDDSRRMTDIERAFWSQANSWVQGNKTTAPAIDAFGVIAVVAFAVLAIVASAAFATSARRQLTTVGQLSANGASIRNVRMSLALQGLWTGLAAVHIGLVPIVLFIVWGQSLVERVSGHAVYSIQWSSSTLVWTTVVALVASTLSAWVPARSAARVSVLDALAGRRPERVAPRVYVGAGVTLFVSGLGLEFLAAAGARQSESPGGTRAFFYAAVIGGLAILGSIGFLGPVLIRIFDFVGSRSSGSLRLASRGLARNRIRSAAVVVSIAAFGALGAAGATGYLFANRPLDVWFPYDQVREFQISCPMSIETMLDCTISDNPMAVSESIDRIVGDDATSFPLRWATYEPATPFGSPVGDGYRFMTRPAHVSSPKLLDAMKISTRDRESLGKFGIISLMTREDIGVNDPAGDGNLSVKAVLVRTDGKSEFQSSLLTSRPAWLEGEEFLVTEEFARNNGLLVFTAGRLVVSPRALTDNQNAQLGVLLNSYLPSDLGLSQTMFDDKGGLIEMSEDFDPTRVGAVQPTPSMTYNTMRPPMDPRSVQAIVALVTLVLVAFVVAVGLALMAAEGKDERDVLVSIGSSPTVQARIAGLRSAALTVLGMLLAFPAGVVPTLLSVRTMDAGSVEPSWSQIPWLLGGMYLALPAAMMLISMVASTVAQTVRPVRISNSAFE